MNMMRPRKTIAALALTLAGTVAAMPAVAGADPTISATTGGVSVIDTTGTVGQIIDMSITGCTTSTGTAGYIGEFVGYSPSLAPGDVTHPVEAMTDETGSLSGQIQIPLDNGSGTFYAHWYCSDSSAATPDDASIRWISPTVTMTIQAGGQSQAMATRSLAQKTTSKSTTKSTTKSTKKSTKQSVTAKAPTTASSSPVTITVDPDSLPALDKIGIFGPQAAALKARVDRAFGPVSNIVKVYKFLKPKASADEISHLVNSLYVNTAFDVVGKNNPSAKQVAAQVAALDGGGLKVQAIEAIALTAHDAAWWNKHTAV
jgi:hypothetical protein